MSIDLGPPISTHHINIFMCPLLYRWKHWEPFCRYVLRGVTVGGGDGIFPYLIVLVSKDISPLEIEALDEDAPDLNPATKQAVRLGKTRTMVLDPGFKELGSALAFVLVDSS